MKCESTSPNIAKSMKSQFSGFSDSRLPHFLRSSMTCFLPSVSIS